MIKWKAHTSATNLILSLPFSSIHPSNSTLTPSPIQLYCTTLLQGKLVSSILPGVKPPSLDDLCLRYGLDKEASSSEAKRGEEKGSTAPPQHAQRTQSTNTCISVASASACDNLQPSRNKALYTMSDYVAGLRALMDHIRWNIRRASY